MSSRSFWIASMLVVAVPAAAQDWPRYGHDGVLTGRCPIRGAISVPHVAWTYSMAGRELLVELHPAPGEHRLSLHAAATAEPRSPLIAPAGPQPIDIDGRGTRRPAVESFHERWAKILPGVRQWHVVVLNAADGKVVWDLPRRFAQRAADIDGDGAAELFTTTTNGELVPTCGTIELVGIHGSAPVVRWSRRDAAWCLADLPCFGPTWSMTASQGMQHVLVRGNTCWIAEGSSGKITTGKELASRRELPAWAAYGEPLVYDFNDDGRPEVLLDSPYLLALLDVSGKPLWHGLGRHPPLPRCHTVAVAAHAVRTTPVHSRGKIPENTMPKINAASTSFWGLGRSLTAPPGLAQSGEARGTSRVSPSEGNEVRREGWQAGLASS